MNDDRDPATANHPVESDASPALPTAGSPPQTRPRPRPADAALLQDALDAVAELPVVDAERVSALRTAIARGEYRIDAERIAARMLDAHDEP